MKDILKIFTIFTPKQQRYCFFIIFLMIIGAFLEAVGIGAIMPLIAIMGDDQFLIKHQEIAESVAWLNIYTHNAFIIFVACLLIGFYILKNVYITWLTKLQINFSTRRQIFYARALLAEYLNKPYLYHLDQNSATLLRNVSDGTLIIFTGILIPIFTLITEVITAVAIWLMLLVVDSFTAIVVAGLLASMMYGILKVFRQNIGQRGEIKNQYSSLYHKWLNQGLGAIKETKVLRKEAYFLNQFGNAYEKYGQATGQFNFINQLPRMIIETLVTCGLLMMIVTKIAMGAQPVEIVPLLGVLALAAFRLMPCANRIVNLSNGIKFQLPLFELLYDDLMNIRKRNDTSILAEGRSNSSKMLFEQSIEVKDLSFVYPEGQKEVLRQVSFEIPKGCFVGIIGQSGTGKTTFVDIMLGLLKPTTGNIFVDDQDIFSDIRVWQANLAYVPQSIYLIDGSIRENVALGIAEQEIDDELVNKVLEMAELYDFVQELPEQVYTHVGERGVKLSGGQRQRIGIARALYCKPSVLILDEATSALDNETEKNITKTILKLKGQVTIIAIAHRVSTLSDCDFKIQFNEGSAKVISNM